MQLNHLLTHIILTGHYAVNIQITPQHFKFERGRDSQDNVDQIIVFLSYARPEVLRTRSINGFKLDNHPPEQLKNT